jgi:flagellar basal body-associated protein FliL
MKGMRRKKFNKTNKVLFIIGIVILIIGVILVGMSFSKGDTPPQYTITVSSVGSIYTINALPVTQLPKNTTYIGILEVMYMNGTIFAKTTFVNTGSITVQITQPSEAVVIVNNTIVATQVIQPYIPPSEQNSNVPVVSLMEAVVILFVGYIIISFYILHVVDKKIKGEERVADAYSSENVPAEVQTMLKIAGHKIDNIKEKKLLEDLIEYMQINNLSKKEDEEKGGKR